MLPVVHETGGPPSSRRRRPRRATAISLITAASTVPGKGTERVGINARNTGAGRISRLTSTATMMTMALTVLLVLVPAAFPEKITIEMTASLFRIVMRTRRNRYDGHGVLMWVYGEGSLPRSNYAARAGRASPHRCSVVTSKTLRTIYFWWNYAKGINAHPLAVSWYITVEDTDVRCLCEGRQGHLPLKQTRRSPNAINSTVLPDKGDRTVCP
ncbi:Uncharacterized protein DBV15_07211 [Temnothorax longispinosus]|uniref:Uncharacterized protein n=1 Tax=Temnothorax longispinosus TaxID=300112 RepID=A0A4S2JBI8_9HYME|nr:Uncharacterized protein DBV15_07211 [Temnothorax longispinosus]